MADRRRLITTAAAAELAGVSRTALFTLAGRARAAVEPVELQADRAEWPDGRTPLWDRARLESYLARRPGRGANLRKWCDCPAPGLELDGACSACGLPIRPVVTPGGA